MESQNVGGIQTLKDDISEIKRTLKDLAMAMTTLALHSQRLDNLESRLGKFETALDESWEILRTVETRCALRGRLHFAQPELVHPLPQGAPRFYGTQDLPRFIFSSLDFGDTRFKVVEPLGVQRQGCRRLCKPRKSLLDLRNIVL